VLQHYATIVHAGYEDSLTAAKAMQTAIAQFLAAPSADSLTAARRWWLAAFAAAAVVEAAVTVAPYCRRPPSAVLRRSPSEPVRFLQTQLRHREGRIVAVPEGVGQPFTPALFGLADIRGVFALPIDRYRGYLDAMMPGSSGLMVQRIAKRRSPLLDLATVRWVVVPRVREPASFLEDDPELPLGYAGEHVLLYENRAALPRVRIAHDVVPVPGPDASEHWLRVMAERQHARVTDPIAIEPDAEGRVCPPLTPATGSEWVRITDVADPDRLVVRASLTSPGVVVVADTYYRGWRARVDGAPAAIFPAALLFRAVFVPAGQHEVVMEYAPASLRIAGWLFAVGCAGCLLSVVTARSRAPSGHAGRRDRA
ncbi:MAG TPA: imelysin family protein, partial [Candidatus Binatia bacterium]|nr:imelysin family protein [Candidatus Binatia bacterium]